MKIYKYILTAPDCLIEMPLDAEILSVAVQRENICLWAKVREDVPSEVRRFVSYGTGDEVRGEFLGTVLLYQGIIVMHVFEIK